MSPFPVPKLRRASCGIFENTQRSVEGVLANPRLRQTDTPYVSLVDSFLASDLFGFLRLDGHISCFHGFGLRFGFGDGSRFCFLAFFSFSLLGENSSVFRLFLSHGCCFCFLLSNHRQVFRFHSLCLGFRLSDSGSLRLLLRDYCQILRLHRFSFGFCFGDCCGLGFLAFGNRDHLRLHGRILGFDRVILCLRFCNASSLRFLPLFCFFLLS